MTSRTLINYKIEHVFKSFSMVNICLSTQFLTWIVLFQLRVRAKDFSCSSFLRWFSSLTKSSSFCFLFKWPVMRSRSFLVMTNTLLKLLSAFKLVAEFMGGNWGTLSKRIRNELPNELILLDLFLFTRFVPIFHTHSHKKNFCYQL